MNDAILRTATLTPIAGVAGLAERFDAFILDLWGCIHDGERPYPHVVEALARLQAAGKRVLVLSNAPRRAQVVAESLLRFGIPGSHYNAVLTSGEVTWQMLARRTEPWHAALGRRVFLMGPERDLGMVEGNGLAPVQDLAQADFLLATGPQSDDYTLDDQLPALRIALSRRLPMVCANPDLEVMRGTTRLICAGLLAQWYSAQGGDVRYHGKPYDSVYREARRLLGDPALDRVVAIGDGLRTDIAGAAAAGIASAFIAGGIHGAELGTGMGRLPAIAAAAALADRFGARPTYLLPELRWT